MNITAQIFGLGAMAALFCTYQQIVRKRLIATKLIADVFWVIHYFLLGGTAGMIPNFIGIFREIVFIKRESKQWADKVIWPILFILCSWIIGTYTFRNIFDILPIAASTFVTISLWNKNPRLTKLITIPVSTAFLVYDFRVGSFIGMVNESFCICSIIISFIKEYIRRGK